MSILHSASLIFAMSRMNFLPTILILISAYLQGVHNLDYSDLEALGETCHPRDSCNGYRSSQSFYEKNCECDYNCNAYKDCCINAPSRTSSGASNSQSSKMCLPFGGHTNTGVFVVNSCRRNWSGPAEVRQKCQGQEDLTDPLKAVPVVDTRNRVAYKNRYCSECNDIQPSRLASFQILLNCETLSSPNVTDSYIWSNLELNASTGKWGVNRWNASRGINEFNVCDLYFNISDTLMNKVRMCHTKVIATCPSSWRRIPIKRACESYQAVVYGGDKIYKNPHCALCNGLTVDQYNCFTGEISGKKKPMSFALLLDVNQSDGDEVGVSRRGTPSCSSGQMYDPFFKKCRSLVCALPGYEMVNGKCRRPS